MGQKSYLILPVIAFGILGFSALQTSFPATWGPTEPRYRLIMQYRTDAHVLDRGLTREGCVEALPFGDSIKQVHFTCEREG